MGGRSGGRIAQRGGFFTVWSGGRGGSSFVVRQSSERGGSQILSCTLDNVDVVASVVRVVG
jgi:hypothetical protein